MKVTRRFRVKETEGEQRYQLFVDRALIGSDDFLGVEESLSDDLSGSIVDQMIQRGVQRTTAMAFAWAFFEYRKKRQETGGGLTFLEQTLECDQ